MNARRRLFDVIEPASSGKNALSIAYDYFTMFVILLSLVPLAFKENNRVFEIIDWVCVGIFLFDYLLRWITADFKFGNRSVLSFLRYPFTFMALVDLISILPSFTVLHQGFKLLRLFRLLRAFRVFRVFKAFRHSKNLRVIASVLKSSRRSLASVGTLAIGYVLVSALVIFNVEPDSFNSFFDAVYWATTSLTTVGYGDIYAVSVAGKIVTMISSLVGIAVIALPSGIITAGYMHAIDELNQAKMYSQKRKVKNTVTVAPAINMFDEDITPDDDDDLVPDDDDLLPDASSHETNPNEHEGIIETESDEATVTDSEED